MEFRCVLVFVLALVSGSQATMNLTLCDNQDADMFDKLNEARIGGYNFLNGIQEEKMKKMHARSEMTDDDLTSLFTMQLLHPQFLSQLPYTHRDKLRVLMEQKLFVTMAQATQKSDGRDPLPYINPVKLSKLLLAMEAGCIDTKDFFGRNVEYHLTKLTQKFPEPNYRDLMQFAFSMLPLCTTNSPIYEKAWYKLMTIENLKKPCQVIGDIDDFKGTDTKYHDTTIATTSMLILTTKCAENQVTDEHREFFDKVMAVRVNCLTSFQNESSGQFGSSVATTAIAVQALLAVKANQTTWNCNGAVGQLVSSRPGAGGRIAVDVAMHVLPALVGRSIGGLWKANVTCPEGRARLHYPDPISVTDTTVTFSLIVYNNITMEETEYNITGIEGENLLYALMRTMLDPEIDFNFTAKQVTFHGEKRIFVAGVNGVYFDKENFYHWIVKKMEDGEYGDDGKHGGGDRDMDRGMGDDMGDGMGRGMGGGMGGGMGRGMSGGMDHGMGRGMGGEKEEDFEMKGLADFEPSNGDTFYLVYLDLSPYREMIERALGGEYGGRDHAGEGDQYPGDKGMSGGDHSQGQGNSGGNTGEHRPGQGRNSTGPP